MFLSKKQVCILIDQSSVKIAEASLNKEGFKVYFLDKCDLPETVLLGGRILNKEEFTKILREFFKEKKLKFKEAVVGVLETNSFLTIIQTPAEVSDINQELERRLSEVLPYSREEAVVLWQKVKQANFQAMAIERNILDSYITTLKEAGLKVKTIVPLPLIYQFLVGEKKPPYLILASESTRLSLSVVAENCISFTASLNIASDFNESREEILKFIKEALDYASKHLFIPKIEDIYLVGQSTEVLESILKLADFKVVPLPTKILGQDAKDYFETILISSYDKSILSFKKESKNQEPINKNLSVKKPKSSTFLIVVSTAFIIGLIVLSFMIFKDSFIGTFDKFFKEDPVTEKEVEKEASTGATPKESTTSAEAEESTASAQEATQSAKVTLDKSTFKIKILNGSGKEGGGQEAADFLKNLGYTIVSVGNATTFNHETTQLQVKASRENFTGVLTNDLEAKYTITSGQALEELEEFDALITIGKI